MRPVPPNSQLTERPAAGPASTRPCGSGGKRCNAAGLRLWRKFRTTDRCSLHAKFKTENDRSEVTS